MQPPPTTLAEVLRGVRLARTVRQEGSGGLLSPTPGPAAAKPSQQLWAALAKRLGQRAAGMEHTSDPTSWSRSSHQPPAQ